MNQSEDINIRIKVNQVIKYIIMFVAMTLAAYYVPTSILESHEILMLGVISSIIVIVLDMYYPEVKKINY